MPRLIRAPLSQRPQGPTLPSGRSWQSRYVRRWSVRNGLLIDSRGGIPLEPVAISGPSVTPLADVLPDMGLVARTQNNGATAFRAFTVPWPTPLDGLTEVTILYWIYPLAMYGGQAYWGQGTTNTTFGEGSTSGSTCGPRWSGGSDQRGQFTEVMTINNWQLMGWQANASSTTYLRNGVQVQTRAGGCGTISACPSGEPFYVGGEPSGSGGISISCDAFFADFRIYPWYLSPQQVAELYFAGRWDLDRIIGHQTLKASAPSATYRLFMTRS